MNAADHSMEHRWGNRVHLDEPATLRSVHGAVFLVRLRNASLSGAFIETTAKPALFARVTLHPIAGEGYSMDAWVVRIAADGIGLEWLEPASESVLDLLSPQRRAAHRLPDLEQLALSRTADSFTDEDLT